jgi:ketosteroid isomerase-like protein
MKSFKTLILISILSLSSGYAASATLESADVENLNSLWSTTFDEGNTTLLMTLYTKDAIVFPPSSEILDSSAAIIAYLDGLIKVGINEYSISNVDLNVKGDIAYETALWEATRVDASGNVIKFEGNITNVLEKQNDGSWKIKYQSWN